MYYDNATTVPERKNEPPASSSSSPSQQHNAYQRRKVETTGTSSNTYSTNRPQSSHNIYQQSQLSSSSTSAAGVPFAPYGGYFGTSSSSTTTPRHDPLIPQQPVQSISPIHQRRSHMNTNIPISTTTTNATTNTSASMLNARPHYSKQRPPPTTNNSSPASYRHNTRIAMLWIPCWCSIYFKFQHTTSVPIHLFLFSTLLIYAIDMANLHRTYTLYMVWITSIIQIITNIWFQLWQIEDGADDGIIYLLFNTGVHAMFYICTASWCTLQCQWLIPTLHTDNSSSNGSTNGKHYYDRDSTFRQLESILHGVLPPVFAVLVTVSCSNGLERTSGMEFATIVTPYVFLLFMTIAMLMVGALPSTLSNPIVLDTTDREDRFHGAMEDLHYCFPRAIAMGHVRLLIYLPGIIHLSNCWTRIVSRYVTNDDVYDLLLALTVPYVTLNVVIMSLHTTNILPSPYGLVLSNSHHQQQLQPKLGDQMLFAVITFLASWSIQQRYLISICHSLSYHNFGTQIPTWQCTMYWTLTTILLYAVALVWGRMDPTTNQLLFGEYHEDAVQLILSAVGLCFGKAFGLPWSMTPLPILGILGLIFWINTRMLRYLSIVLFVIHSIGVVMFTYRYVGIDQTLSLPLPKLELSLVRFGMLLTILSVVIGLITGLAVRSTGGYMASLLKKLDVVGVLSILYTLLLMILEITLFKRPVPVKELLGVDFTDEDLDGTLYDVPKVVFTSSVMIAIVIFMKRIRMLHEWSAAVILSLSLGKAVAIYTYATQSDLGIGNHHIHDKHGTNIVYRALIATILCATMFVPRVFLEPVRLKNSIRSRRTSNAAGGVSGAAIPPHAIRLIGIYAFIFVPISLIATLPYVVFPFVNAVRAQFTQSSYYLSSPPTSELIGSAVALWGLSLISMLNHFLPDGGAEAWKKLASLAFLMGLGIFFVAPTVGLGVGSAMYNPYAHMSSVGRQLIIRGKIRTAGWGIISAALATLLAVSGPLELKERVPPSGRKDKYLLLRTMIFCLLFGGGVSWFIVLQCMSESEWILVLLTVLGAMVLAFLGTVATVLGYYLELQNFEDIEQIAKTWLYGFLIFLPITGIPHLLYSDSPHWFGQGGWLTPYLGVASLTSFSFTLSLLYRHGKESQTKGLGNTACIVTWLLSNIILYGRNGIAGLEPSFDASTIVGIPISVIGTIFLSLILLALDGESSLSLRGRAGGRGTVTTSVRSRSSFWRLNLKQLDRKNQWFPLLAGCFTIFMVSTFYAIFLRGSGLLSWFDVSESRSHNDAIEYIIPDSGGDSAVLTALVKNAVTQSLDSSAYLDRASVWTATNVLIPTIHFLGALSVVPSFFLLQKQYWSDTPVSSVQITAAIPLNAIPIIFCHSIPSLTATAILTLLCAVVQLMGRRQSEHAYRMRI
jgi:hypothetical protein